MPAFGVLMAAAEAGANGRGSLVAMDDTPMSKAQSLEMEFNAVEREMLEEEQEENKMWSAWDEGRPKAENFAKGSLLRKWIEAADVLHSGVTSTGAFDAFFQSCIGIMCILMGLETYDAYERDPTIGILLLILVILFSLEVALKFLAESIKPWRYFGGPNGRWNTMDLLIVVLCLPFLPVGESGRILRMIRLVRLGKIIAKIPSFRVFVVGIEESIHDIVNISALIVLILYMYSIAGMVLFKANDPWHFATLHRSFITLFSMATLDGWAGIMYKNIFGCGLYAQSVEAGILDPHVYNCPSSVPQPLISAVFFLTFVTITGLVMLSMFIGVISIAMSDTIVDMRKERKHHKQRIMMKRRAEQAKGNMQIDVNSIDCINEYNHAQRLMAQTKTLLEGKVAKPLLREPPTVFGKQLAKAACFSTWIVSSKTFQWFIFCLIGLGGVLVGTKMYFPNELTRITHTVGSLMGVAFTTEMVLKILSHGDRPWQYLYRKGAIQDWNVLDAAVVIANYIPGMDTDLLMVFRMVLVLKMMKHHPYLRVSVQSFLAAVSETGTIGGLMGIVFFFFAVLGVVLFKKNDPGHFGNLHVAMLALFRVATLDDWAEVLDTNMYGCEQFEDQALPLSQRQCDPVESNIAREWGGIAALYFLSFVIVGTFVMMNLFIGVIIISMEETMSQLAKDREVNSRASALAKKDNYSKSELENLREMFDMMDEDGGQSISLEELYTAVVKSGVNISRRVVESLLAEVDSDGTGDLDFADFVQFVVTVRGGMVRNIKDGKEAFSHYTGFHENMETKKQLSVLENELERMTAFIADKGLDKEYEQVRHKALLEDGICTFNNAFTNAALTPENAARRLQRVFRARKAQRQAEQRKKAAGGGVQPGDAEMDPMRETMTRSATLMRMKLKSAASKLEEEEEKSPDNAKEKGTEILEGTKIMI
jgi:voltage-gated sodium channel